MSPIVLTYSRFSLINFSCPELREAEMLCGIWSFFLFQENVAFLWDSDFACAANPPSLNVAFFQCLNPSAVYAESLEEGRLKCRQA